MTPDNRTADAVRDPRIRFRIADFPGMAKGRSPLWQAAWILTLQLVWRRWWFPRRARASVLRWFGATVGRNVVIRDDVYLTWPWLITIGDDVLIGRSAQLVTGTGITIGHDVCISPYSVLVTGGHDPRSEDFRIYDYPIRIGNHVWICSYAMILHGVKIPDHTVVNANAVVSFGQKIPRRE